MAVFYQPAYPPIPETMDIKAVIFPFFIQKSQEIELRSNRIDMLDELVRVAHQLVNSDNRQVFSTTIYPCSAPQTEASFPYLGR